MLKNWRDRHFKLHVHLLAEVAELEYYEGQNRRGALLFNHNTFVKRVKDIGDHKCCFTVVTSFEKKTLFASARCAYNCGNIFDLTTPTFLAVRSDVMHTIVLLAHSLWFL